MDGTSDQVLNNTEVGEAAAEENAEESKKRRKRKNGAAGGFRKAPQAPKRFKSQYILFSMSKMEEFKKEDGHTTKVTSISRRVAEAWKNLSVEEKKKWEEAARQDKLRYNAEKSLYTGPWQVSSKRTRKDPTAPKRPMSAFLFFSQGMRKKLKAENPQMKNTEISCLLGERWKTASEEERRPHIEREKKEREQYRKDIAEWRAKKNEEEKATRKRRQDIAEQFVKSGYFQNGYAPQWNAAPQQVGPGVTYQMAPVPPSTGATPGTFQVPPGPAVASTFQQFAGNDLPAHPPNATTEGTPPQNGPHHQEQISTTEPFSLDSSVSLPAQGGQPEFQPQNFPDYLPVQQTFGTHQDISVAPPANEAHPF